MTWPSNGCSSLCWPSRCLLVALAVAQLTAYASGNQLAADSPASASKLPIYRRRECVFDQLWDTRFSNSSALFDSPSTTVDADTTVWTRVDACDKSTGPCIHKSNVDVARGHLVLTASTPAGGARVSVHKPLPHPQQSSTRLRIHTQIPHDVASDVAFTLTRQQTSMSLSVSTGHSSSTDPQLTLGLSSTGHNLTVVVSPPCPLATAKTHVVEFEWTPSHWLRWYWDSHLLYEVALPQTNSSTSSPSAALLEIQATSTQSKPSTVLRVSHIELQRVSADQDDSDHSHPHCWPRVAAHDANCRHHKHYVPRLGEDQGYLSLAQVSSFLHAAVDQFPPQLAHVESIGTSLQNRSLLALCVGNCGVHTAPQILFTGMHHSREPLSMMALIATIDLLALDVANGDASTLALLLGRQLWFVPVVNPDGYARNEAAHMWTRRQSGQRKNARPGCGRESDAGVDLNRNYDVCFAKDSVGSSTDPCGEDYRGAAPFSEPETRAIKDFVERAGADVAVSLNYHSFGRYFNIPFACESLDTPRGVNLSVYESWAMEMTRYNGFKYGQPWKDDNLYSVNGETSDWLWLKHGVFAMSPEVGPAFDTRVDEGFWPPQGDVAELAVELHYSNLVAARLGGAQYDVRVERAEREEAAEEVDGIDALLRVRVAVENKGLRTAGDVDVVLATALGEEEEDGGERRFVTKGTVAEHTLGTIREERTKRNATVTLDLAIPQAEVLHLVVRDAFSCQYIRLSVRLPAEEAGEPEEGTKAVEVVQFQPVELPLCGFCRSLGRDKSERGEEHAVCASVKDLIQPQNFVAQIVSVADAEDRSNDLPSPSPTSSPKPPATTTQSPQVTDKPAEKTTTSPVSETPSSSPTTSPSPSSNAPASIISSSSSSSLASTASFVSVPLLATLLLAVAVVLAIVRRQRRRQGPGRSSGSSTQSYRVINQQLDEDEDEIHRRIVGRRLIASSPRSDSEEEEEGEGEQGEDREEQEEAEYGRRRPGHFHDDVVV